MKSWQSQSTDQHQAGAQAAGPSFLRLDEFTHLRDLIADYSGVYLDTARQRVLENGLLRRLQITGDDLAAYERRLRENQHDELRMLSELVLNHETFFFRNMPHMRALRSTLLPEIHRRKPAGEPIRIWSAGCATGEEAYSLAITALDTLGRPLPRDLEILATDLSEAALRKARAGMYRGRALGNLSPEQISRHFYHQGNGYIVADHVRELVTFEQLNLLDTFPENLHNIDLIFCQNVTIYFQLETCRQLMARFYDCLPEGGLLFLGFSETLWNVFDRLRSREVDGAYVYYKGSQKTEPPAAPRKPSSPPALPSKPERRTIAPAETKRVAPTTQPVNRARQPPPPSTNATAVAQADLQMLQHGRELLAQGQALEALEVLGHISPQSSYVQQALTQTARAHADRGDLDLAVAEIHRALELDTLNEEAYFLLGMIYSRQEQWLPAVQQLERARYLNPSSALISFYLAEAYRKLGRISAATREYRNTLVKLDGHPPGMLLDGVAIGWLRETCQRQLEYLPHAP